MSTIFKGKYDSMRIEERNGVYSIMSGWINRDSDFKINFVTKKFKEEEKVVPLAIALGDKDTAIKILSGMLDDIGTQEENTPF